MNYYFQYNMHVMLQQYGTSYYWINTELFVIKYIIHVLLVLVFSTTVH